MNHILDTKEKGIATFRTGQATGIKTGKTFEYILHDSDDH